MVARSSQRDRSELCRGRCRCRSWIKILLAPLELRLTLLDERLDALTEVLRPEERQELEEDVVHVRLERLLEAEAHHALRRLHCQRGVGGDFSGKLSSCGHELIRLDDVAHEAGFERFLRGKG